MVDPKAVKELVAFYKKKPIKLVTQYFVSEIEKEINEQHEKLLELEDREGVRTILNYAEEVLYISTSSGKMSKLADARAYRWI